MADRPSSLPVAQYSPAPRAYEPPPVELDSEQRAVVEADPSARIIVNAPPGTGKTTVACSRIAWLLDQGIAPGQIWLVSFTRTAVRELRNRISRLAEGDPVVYGVLVTTLDSRAWHMVQGFTGRGFAALASGHNATIADVITLIRSDNEHVAELLDELLHVVVDEAQDLLGDRATLLEEIIRRVPPACGITVLTDEAQSIYGFTEDDSGEPKGNTLPVRLRKWSGPKFVEMELTKVYRTQSPDLQRLFIDARRRLLKAIKKDDADCLGLVRISINDSSAGEAESVDKDPPGDNALVLFRRRYEVLEASSYLGTKQYGHRIRMSGVPVALHPWLAVAFSKPLGTNRLTKAELEERWRTVDAKLGSLAPSLGDAWADLHHAAGSKSGNAVLMDELRDVLSHPRPPLEFVSPELGLTGPILSTIHASKGREADDVRLMLPVASDSRSDVADHEEARVLFVGATRARGRLTVGRGSRSITSRLPQSGRCYHRLWQRSGQKWRAQVEVGLDGDVDVISPVSRAPFETSALAAASQQWLTENIGGVTQLRAWGGTPDQKYAFSVRPGETEDQPILARLSTQFNFDLFGIAKTLWKATPLKPPRWIGPLLLLGVRSITIPVGDPRETEIHRPWRDSGFWLAPIVVGLPTVPFFRSSR